MKRTPLVALLAILIAVALALAGCAAAPSPYDKGEAEVPGAPGYEPAPSPAPDGIIAGTGQAYAPGANAPLADQKLIRTATIEMQTQNYDTDLEKIYTRIQALGGYIENSSETGKKPEEGEIYGRIAYYLARIPKVRFDSFLKELGKIGTLVSRSVESQDVTGQYADTDNKLETAQKKLELLQNFFAKAKTVDEMLDIESRISQVEQDIEALSGQLKYYDSQVDYSSVSITLQEIVDLKLVKTDTGLNISNAFYGGLNAITAFFTAIAVALAASWPFLLFFAALAAGISWLVIGLKRRKAKLAKKAPAAAEKKSNPDDMIKL
ncbi:MAG: DUF4349 domain-containing protein [Bacillota bacterium]|nr:DUF4349 domain-containing protein [Bacillota bacterium]